MWTDLLLYYCIIFGGLIGVGFIVSLARDHGGRYNEIRFVWYDLWIGAYYARSEHKLYVVPFPTIVFILDLSKP